MDRKTQKAWLKKAEKDKRTAFQMGLLEELGMDDKLEQLKEDKTVLDVVVKGVVKAGVIAYVEGVRGFIPASKLSLNYVENLEDYLNKTIQVQVHDIERDKKRLILSAREVLRAARDEERKRKISNSRAWYMCPRSAKKGSNPPTPF